MYKDRIKKPVDIIKQPWLDFERAISRIVFMLLNRFVKPRRYPENVKNILLIRRNKLGDAVNILPAIEGIKKYQPEIRIHVLASQYNAVIFKYNPHVDELHVIDEKWFLGKFSLFMHPVLSRLRRESFDLVIGLGGYSSALAQLVKQVKGKYTVGACSTKGTVYDLVYDMRVKSLIAPDKHHVDDMAHIVRCAQLKLPDQMPCTHMAASVIKQDKWLAICPDVKRKESRYAIENYAQVITRLLCSNKVNKVVLFTEGAKSLYRELEKHGAQWCPTSNVDEFIQEVSKCSWVITAEGGSAHVAGALGLGVVVLSGMGHQAYWRPYAQFVKILEEKQAINNIRVEAIIAAFDELQDEMTMCG